MANQTGRPIAPARKLVAAVMGTIAVFVMALGLGMSSWGVVIFGLALLALSIALGMVNVVRRGARAWVTGTAEVKAISPPPVSSTVYGRAEIQAVVVAPGLPTSEVLIREPRVPVVKWPRVGDTLPITVDVDDMRRVRINWDGASPRATGEDPPPAPAAYEDIADDDLLGDSEPPPWATRETPWDPRVEPPPPAAEYPDSPVVVRDTPAGRVVEGEFVDHDGVTQPLPRRTDATPAATPAGEAPQDGPGSAPPGGPADAPAGGPADVPADGPREAPAGGPADRPAGGPADRPADGPADVPADGPREAPAGGPADRPADGPADVPGGGPATGGAPATGGPGGAPATGASSGSTSVVGAGPATGTPAPARSSGNRPSPRPRSGGTATATAEPPSADRRATDRRAAEPPSAAYAASGPHAATARVAAERETTTAWEPAVTREATDRPEAPISSDPAETAATREAAPAPPPAQRGPHPDDALPPDGPTTTPEPAGGVPAGRVPSDTVSAGPPASAPARDRDIDVPLDEPSDGDIDLPLLGDPDPAPESTAAAATARADDLIAPPPAAAGTVPSTTPGSPEASSPQPTGTGATPSTTPGSPGASTPQLTGTGAMPSTAPGSSEASAPPATRSADPAPVSAVEAARGARSGPVGDASTHAGGVVAGATAAVGAVAAAAVAAVRKVAKGGRDPGDRGADNRTDTGAGAVATQPVEAGDESTGSTTDPRTAPGRADRSGPPAGDADNNVDQLITAYPSARPGPAGAIHGVGITVLVSNLERSVAFYRDTLGFHGIDSAEGSAVLASGDTRLVLRTVHGVSAEAGRLIYLNLEVGDVDAVYQELLAKGVRFVHGPRPVNRGDRLELWSATFRDPDDHNIAITQWRAIH